MNYHVRVGLFWIWLSLSLAVTLFTTVQAGCRPAVRETTTCLQYKTTTVACDDVTVWFFPVLIVGVGLTIGVACIAAPKQWRE